MDVETSGKSSVEVDLGTRAGSATTIIGLEDLNREDMMFRSKTGAVTIRANQCIGLIEQYCSTIDASSGAKAQLRFLDPFSPPLPPSKRSFLAEHRGR